MTRTTAICSTILALYAISAASAHAGPATAGDIPASAELVAHLDIAKLRSSKLGRTFDAEIRSTLAQADAALKSQNIPLSSADINKITGVTVWLEGSKDEHGALIVTGLPTKRVLAALRKIGKAASVKPVRHNGQAMFEMTDGGDKTYIAARAGKIIVADKKKSVSKTLRAMSGSIRNMAGSARLAKLSRQSGVFALAVFDNKIAKKIQQAAGSGLFKAIGFAGAHATAKVVGNNVVLTAVVETTDTAGASKLGQMATGGLALLSLGADDPDVAAIVNASRVTTTGKEVRATLSVPISTIKKMAPPIGNKGVR